MELNKTKNVANLGRNDPEALAKLVGLKGIQTNESQQAATSKEVEPSRNRVKDVVLGMGVVAASAFLLLPRGEGEAPKPPERSYTELAQEQAKIQLSPEDTVLIEDIEVDPSNPTANSASEAILDNAQVVEYIVDNPNQSSAITASAMNVPSTGKYAIVERDIDSDGDGDAIAVADNR